MQYPHTWIVWVGAKSMHRHMTIQEMSAVRSPSCTENFHIFFEGLRKHFLYVCNPTDCVTKIETFSEKCKKISQWPPLRLSRGQRLLADFAEAKQ